MNRLPAVVDSLGCSMTWWVGYLVDVECEGSVAGARIFTRSGLCFRVLYGCLGGVEYYDFNLVSCKIMLEAQLQDNNQSITSMLLSTITCAIIWKLCSEDVAVKVSYSEIDTCKE